MTVFARRGLWRWSKNSRCVREHWCRAWTDNALSCDIPWDRGILGHFFNQHTLNIALTPGRKKTFFLNGFRTIWQTLKKRFVSIGVKKCWKNMMSVPQKIVTNHGSVRMSPKQQSIVCVFKPESNPTKVVWRKGKSVVLHVMIHLTNI